MKCEIRRHKFCSKLLNFDQKNGEWKLLRNLANNDAELLKRVLTGGETCVYGYDVETKAQSSQ